MLIHFIHGYYCIYRPWQPLTYLCFPYHCISLIYFSFTMIRIFLYAQIYWLAEFGDVSCLQFNYLRVETLTPTWEDLVGHLSVWSPTKLSVRPECWSLIHLEGSVHESGTSHLWCQHLYCYCFFLSLYKNQVPVICDVITYAVTVSFCHYKNHVPVICDVITYAVTVSFCHYKNQVPCFIS